MSFTNDLSDSSSSSDPLDTMDDEGWEDVEPDEESATVLSLFDDKTFPDARSMLSYSRDQHGFDIWKLRKDFGEFPPPHAHVLCARSYMHNRN